MATEIERKFLVLKDPIPYATKALRLAQGYVAKEIDVSVRIRITDEERAQIGIKRRLSSTERAEFEFDVPVPEAREMIDQVCKGRVIEKTRYLIPAGSGLVWEVDVFHGNNDGLVVAEIELPHSDAPFDKPDWLGEEVTEDIRYLNNQLVENPWPGWVGS